MADDVSAGGKDHSPRQGRLPSIKFTIDEIAEPNQPQTNRCGSRYEVRDFPEIPLASLAEKQGCQYDPYESSVERHSTLPDIKNLNGKLDIAAEVVEQNVP